MKIFKIINELFLKFYEFYPFDLEFSLNLMEFLKIWFEIDEYLKTTFKNIPKNIYLTTNYKDKILN